MKELSRQYDQFEKDARRISVLGRVNDEEGTIFVLRATKDSCEESTNYSEALQLTLNQISIYSKMFKNKNDLEHSSTLKSLGELATRVCMEQKQNYW